MDEGGRLVIHVMDRGGWVGVDETPGVSPIVGAPQLKGNRVDPIREFGVEDEITSRAQVERAPGVASVFGDITPCHVGRDEDEIWVKRADVGIVETSSTARANDPPGIEALRL